MVTGFDKKKAYEDAGKAKLEMFSSRSNSDWECPPLIHLLLFDDILKAALVKGNVIGLKYHILLIYISMSFILFPKCF